MENTKYTIIVERIMFYLQYTGNKHLSMYTLNFGLVHCHNRKEWYFLQILQKWTPRIVKVFYNHNNWITYSIFTFIEKIQTWFIIYFLFEVSKVTTKH